MTVVSVQRNPAPGEVEAVAEALGRPVFDAGALNTDLEAMLALMAALDRYAGVSNTNTHLRAAAGLGSDVLSVNPEIKTVRSPYADGEELVAMPALALDVAFVHMNRADVTGNAQYLGPDFYFDDLYLMAAKRRFVTCEKIVDTKDFLSEGTLHTLRINRTMVDGVIEAPGGAHFTECPPDYGRDEKLQSAYAKTAKDPEAWEAFKADYLDVSEAEYQKKVRRSDADGAGSGIRGR